MAQSNSLPDDVDIVIVGSGIVETIVAAAASRIGRSVLQLDDNCYYGADSASFSLNDFSTFLQQQQIPPSPDTPDCRNPALFDPDSERAIALPTPSRALSNIEEVRYLRQPVDEADVAPNRRHRRRDSAADLQHSASALTTTESQRDCGESRARSRSLSEILFSSPSAESPLPNSDLTSPPNPDSIESGTAPPNPEPLTYSHLTNQSRRFSIDLSPKLLLADDAFTRLLKSSNVSRYLTLHGVTKLVVYDGSAERLATIPCSRADVHRDARLSLREKNFVMRFLRDCHQSDDAHVQRLESSNGIATLDQLLAHYKLPEILRQAIRYTILFESPVSSIELAGSGQCETATSGSKAQCETTISGSDRSAREAIAGCRRFLRQCGAYGSHTPLPYLCIDYGTGDVAQSFARFAAVFGATQCLQRGAEHLIVRRDNDCAAAVACLTDGQRVNARHFLLSSRQQPASISARETVSRAVIISDRSLLQSDEIVFGRWIDNGATVTLVELSPHSECCPRGMRLAYLWRRQSNTARRDLEPLVKRLYKPFSYVDAFLPGSVEEPERPRAYYVAYYNHEALRVGQDSASSGIGENVLVCSTTAHSIDFCAAAEEARRLFERICPGEEFLPRAPDPEDIIIGGVEADQGNACGSTESNGVVDDVFNE